MHTLLTIAVLGTIVLALAVDIGALVSWLARPPP
jgi:hypothetical protein